MLLLVRSYNLKFFDPEKLFNLIVEGRSMGINSLVDKFYSSSIVGGSFPIALGVAQSIKSNKQTKPEGKHFFWSEHRLGLNKIISNSSGNIFRQSVWNGYENIC